MLGLCANDGSVTHYRGRIQLTRDSAGNRRVVNDVPVEAYLRGVVPREVSTSWGNAGGGAGMNALRAQAVAARSYALSQNRYASSGGYATTCDTQACQVYGGAARRPSATAATSSGGTCESGNATFECANTNRAIAETAGRVRRSSSGAIVATEFSASNGPRTAGGTFPAINDPFDDVPQNPNHRWTRIIDGDLVAAAYGLGTLTAATTEPDPATPFSGVWDNRVRLTGTGGTVLVSSWNFRTAYGLPSHGFTVRAVVRGVVASNVDAHDRRLRRAEHDGELDVRAACPARRRVHGAAYDNATNRCTADCGLSGVGAAASVPIGTDLVVVELGYNSPTSDFGARIDSMMRALEARQVERVVWINLSTRSGRADFVAANQALAAARSRWPDLFVLDWASYSAGSGRQPQPMVRHRRHPPHRHRPSRDGPLRAQPADPARRLPRRQLDLHLGPRDRLVGGAQHERLGVPAAQPGDDAPSATTVVVGGDFDRDGDVDEVFIWNRDQRVVGRPEHHQLQPALPVERDHDRSATTRSSSATSTATGSSTTCSSGTTTAAPGSSSR